MLTPALSEDPLLGMELGHYRILEKIGSGGMGVVYRARDQHLDREVAIKVLHPGTLRDESRHKHFREEAMALSKLNHPNIATIYDFDAQGELDFLVMEYIPGIVLSEKLTAGPLPEDELRRLAIQIAEGLSAAHEHGVVHRDLKPGNLQLTNTGGLKILDFGLAKFRSPASASASTESVLDRWSITGTLAYMAPEQVSGGTIDARTDIHAAGLVMYEMATGQRAFREEEISRLISAILRSSPPPAPSLNPKLSPDFARIIGKCLEKEPGNRYQSARDLAADLTCPALPASALLSSAEPPARSSRPGKLAAAAILIALAAMVAVGALFVHGPTASDWNPHDSIVLADFENLTGEKLFDHTVTEAIREAISQSQYVRLMPQSQVLETAQRMERTNLSPLDEALAREICRRENCRALLTGRIVPSGRKYKLTIRLLDPSSGTQFLAQDATFGSPAELYKAADGLTKSLRTNLGESLAQVNQHSLPLAKVTTPSLDALQRYSRAMEFYAAADYENFIPLARSAVEIDPGFAMAHLYLARALDWQGDDQGPRLHMEQARQNLGRVTERERLLILATDFEFQGLFEKAAEQSRLLTELYPDDLEGFRVLQEASFGAGRPEQGLAALQKALALNPRGEADQQRLIIHLTRLNRFSEALASYQEARGQGSRRPMLHWGAGLAYLGQGDSQSARREFELLGKEGGPYEAGLSSLYLSRVLIYEGRLREATDALTAGLILGEKLHNESWIPVQRYLLANVLRTGGRISQARAELRGLALTAILPSLEQELRRTGLLAAHLGDMATARRLLGQLAALAAKRDSGFTKSCYYNLKGAVELASGNAESAVESQRRAAVFYPSYQAHAGLAEAYAARHEWLSAAAASRRYLDFKGEIFDDDSPGDWVLMHLALARALAKGGDTKHALESYQEFLQLWAHADSDLPVMQEARAEQARLGGRTSLGKAGPKTTPANR